MFEELILSDVNTEENNKANNTLCLMWCLFFHIAWNMFYGPQQEIHLCIYN